MFKNKKHVLRKTAAALIAAAMLCQPVSAAETYESRDAVPAEYKWDLTDIFASPEAIESDMNLLTETYIPGYEKYRGKLDSKEYILACLNHLAEANRILYRLYNYAYCSTNIDLSNPEAQEFLARLDTVNQKDTEAAAFIYPELSQADSALLQSCLGDPAFETYVNDLEGVLADKAHALSEDESALLAQMQNYLSAPYNIFIMANDVDISFEPAADSEGNAHEVTLGTYAALLESPDRSLRKAASESIGSAYAKLSHTLAETLSAEVNKNNFLADAYNYDSAAESALEFGIPLSVYENLIETVNTNFSGLHKYVSLRKEALKLDELYPYDMYAPIVAEDNTTYSFEEAKKLALAALKPLGEDYAAALEKGFNENWVDVYETPNKTSGAYSSSLTYDSHPLVLLNFSGTLYDVSTLAHEMGHAMHGYYSNSNQPFNDAGQSIFTAEVASTLNEILLYRYLIDNAETNAEKLSYTMSLAELYLGTFYTQTMYAEFEKDIHETAALGGSLSADALNGKWLALTEKYYGDEYNTAEFTPSGWSRIEHFYMNFYVYQYATGIAAANEIAAGIMDGNPEAVENYLTFLSSGSKYDPIETLAIAGADLNDPAVIEDFAKEFERLVSETERLMAAEGLIQ